MSRHRSAVLCVCVVFGSCAFVQRCALAQYRSSLSFHGGLGFATTSYSQEAAARSGTVARSFGVQSFLEPRLYETVGLPITVGWEYLGPICFEGGSSGDCSARSEPRTSLLFGSIGAALYGPTIAGKSDNAVSPPRPYLIVGREWVSQAVGVDGCLTCTIESVQFDGGRFIEPGIEFSVTREFLVGVGYRAYDGNSDLENRVVLRLSSIGR